MTRNFGALIEEVEAIVDDREPEPISEDLDALYESIDLENISERKWTPETSVVWIATMLEELIKEEGLEESEAKDLLAMMLEAAWTPYLEPKEKDVRGDVGTIDEPPQGGIPKSRYRGGASGMTPAMERGLIALVTRAAEAPPGFVINSKIEDAVPIWKEAAGKAINKGIGWTTKVDKKTGIEHPVPDYETIVSIWKDMVDKVAGFRPTAAMDKTIDKDIEQHRKKAAKDMAKGVAKVGKKRARQASSLMRGARGKSKKGKKGKKEKA